MRLSHSARTGLVYESWIQITHQTAHGVRCAAVGVIAASLDEEIMCNLFIGDKNVLSTKD